jgi:hypothetical protein
MPVVQERKRPRRATPAIAGREESRGRLRAPVFASGFVTLGAVEHDVVCLDISEGGLALRMRRMPAIGEIARFDLTLDPGTRLRGTGEIVRGGGRRKDEVGLKFISIHKDSMAALKAYVAARPNAVVRFPAAKR